MTENQRFAAFISHRSQDKEFVFWLQKKLEHYSVGKQICERYLLRAKTVSPLCVDSYEFTSNELKKEIAQKLDQSKKMIVICSRASASPVSGRLDWSADPSQIKDWSADPFSSGWVGYEIDYMLKAGRQKDIIPVVIDGDPETGDCIHPLLKNLVRNDLLYYDFRKHKRTDHLTFLKLVGATLGIENLGEIYDHDAKRKRLRSSFFVVLGLTVAAAGIWAWSYFLPHGKNYADYILLNGLPQGIRELSSSEVIASASHYVITTTKAQHLVELKHVNSSLTPVEDETDSRIDRPMIAVYRCRSNWSPDTVEYYDRNGIVQMTYAYATDMRYMTFQKNEHTSDQVYPSTEVDDYGVPIRMKIDRYDLTYEEGRLIRRMYMSGVNYCVDESGVAGEQYSYDDLGRITARRYLNRSMDVSANKNGVAGMDYSYDAAGRLQSTTIVDTAGNPVYGPEWYSVARYSYSGYGQIVLTVYYTPEGAETVCSSGYSRAVREYDDKGNKIKEYFVGPSGEPVYCTDKYHCANYSYNELGDMLSAAYYDENGGAVLHKQGYAALRWERDAHGNPTKTVFCGTSGEPMPSDNYAAIVRRSFNSAGYVVEESYYDMNDHEMITSEGYFRRTVDCDENGYPMDITIYGLNEQPVYCSDGWHRMHLEYDDRGNLGKITLYGTSGQLLPFGGEWAIQERKYNGGGQVVSLRFADQFGKPVVARGLYASIENTYDDRGLLTSSTYYDSDGRLMTGYASIKGGVQVGKRSYAKVEYEYDEAGNEIRRTYYDTNGELTTDIAPFTDFEYDDVGRVIRYSHREKDGEPTTIFQAASTFTYDEYGRLNSVACYDSDGNLTMGSGGYAIRLSKRDLRGNLIESMDTGTKGELIGNRILYDYDEYGMQVDARYVDLEGKPVMNANHYSVVKLEHDTAGNQIRLTSYDTKGNPVERSDGYCTQEKSFDAGGNLVGIRYYGTNGEPVDLPVGYHGFSAQYNDYRLMTGIAYFDKDESTLFSYEATYKDCIYPTEEALYGRNGEPIESKGFNIWKVTAEYDENNQKTSTRYYGKDGQLHLLLDQFAGWSSEYESGLETERTYYGTDGKPVMIDTGFASVRMERDEYGREVRRLYFGPDGKPVDNLFGFSVMEVEYGEDGELSSSVFYNTKGEKVDPDGEACLEDMFLYDNAEEKTVYNPETGRTEKKFFSVGSYRVRLLAFQASNGSVDQLAQPRYYLFNAYAIDEYLSQSAKSFIPKVGENEETIDISGYEEADNWTAILDRYTMALEEGNGKQITAMMDLSVLEGAAEKLNSMVNEPKSPDELGSFYADYWQKELDGMRESFSDIYGEDFKIDYQILNVKEADEETVESLNKAVRDFAPVSVEYTGIVELTVRYTVVGAKSSSTEQKGYLTPMVVLYKTKDGWMLGTGNGFPRPSTEELTQFMGGIRK